LGLAAAAAAIGLIARGGPRGAASGEDEIDAASRAQLERVLERADRESAP
jgi:hypothetical protein